MIRNKNLQKINESELIKTDYFKNMYRFIFETPNY